MFKSRKTRRIMQYLDEKPQHQPFDYLLQDYLSGALKQRLADMGFSRIEIYVDWLEDYKCVNIGALHRCGLCLDFQAEPACVNIALDEEEPDDAVEFEIPADPHADSADIYYDILADQLIGKE